MILYKMPKKVMDYSKTIIYKIVCNDLNIIECYVGHTTNFVKRKNRHKHSCNTETNNSHNYKIYKFIRENGGWDNWSMIEIEKYPCNDINEAIAKERYWYEQLDAKLNTDYPAKSKKEWTQENYETIKVYQKEYRETNKEQIKAKKNQKFNCPCGGKYSHNDKSRHYKTQKHKDFMALKTDTTV